MLHEYLPELEIKENPLKHIQFAHKIGLGMDCNSVYVGETGRNLEKRLKEHQYAVKRMDNKNGIFSVHSWKKSHRVNWDESRVLKMIPNYFHRRLTEALIIEQ